MAVEGGGGRRGGTFFIGALAGMPSRYTRNLLADVCVRGGEPKALSDSGRGCAP